MLSWPTGSATQQRWTLSTTIGLLAVFLIELLSAASAYSVLVPLLAEARAKGETEAQRCVQSISALYITLMPGLCCLLVGISWAVSQFFFPGAGLTPSITIGIVCGFLIFAIVSAERWILKAILDTYQAFQLPVIVQGIRAVLVIGTIYLFKPVMAWLSIPLALILGELFQVLILFPRCCAVLNLRVRDLKIDWQETPYIKSFLRQCILMMGAAIADGLNPVCRQRHGKYIMAQARYRNLITRSACVRSQKRLQVSHCPFCYRTGRRFPYPSLTQKTLSRGPQSG